MEKLGAWSTLERIDEWMEGDLSYQGSRLGLATELEHGSQIIHAEGDYELARRANRERERQLSLKQWLARAPQRQAEWEAERKAEMEALARLKARHLLRLNMEKRIYVGRGRYKWIPYPFL